VPKLKDRVLMGHLIGVRLMHPKTVSSYHDLQQWLNHYNDHYQAITAYQLANKRRPKTGNNTHKTPTFWSPTVARYEDPDAVKAIADPQTKARNKIKSELYRLRRYNKHKDAVAEIKKTSVRKTLGE